MKMVLNRYELQARLSPALLVLLPAFIMVAIWFPSFYKTASGLIGIAVASGLTLLLGQLARNRGVLAQDKLTREWGRMPTTLWLRHADPTIDATTKARYHLFLQNKIPDWTIPTKAEEADNKQNADEKYQSAVRWLREYTRDAKKHPLVLNENILYGFRRNAYGLKPFGIFVAITVLLFISMKMIPFSTQGLMSEKIPYTATFIVTLALLIWWVFGVTKNSVFMAAKGYARALLAVCDQ